VDPFLEPYDEALDARAGKDTVEMAEQRLDILAALQDLPAIHREALTLFYFDDMPVAEMALALDVAPGTVLSRLNRARDALRLRMHPTAAPVESTAQVIEFPYAATRSRDE
jgi:RNA polymerase sigma-70 factor (ECF subfamily)